MVVVVGGDGDDHDHDDHYDDHDGKRQLVEPDRRIEPKRGAQGAEVSAAEDMSEVEPAPSVASGSPRHIDKLGENERVSTDQINT